MRVYPDSTHSGAVTWPAPIEPVYQMLPAQGVQLAGYKRSDLSLADRLFIAAVANLPPERRPWGSITWLADVFNTSHPTVYALGERGAQECKCYP